MAANSPPQPLVELTRVLKPVTGVCYSRKWATFFFCTPSAFYSFESLQGSSGIGQVVAGTNVPTDGDSTEDGEAKKATFCLQDATCITEDSEGGFFLPEPRSRLVRRVNMHSSKVETQFGRKRIAHSALSFLKPTCAIYDNSGNLIVVDSGLHRIISINAKNIPTVIAGTERRPGFCDGSSDTLLHRPHTAVFIHGVGILFTDSGNNRIRRISLNHTVSTIAGNGVRGTKDGPALTSTFADPTGMISNAQGDLIILESSTMRLRMLQNGIVSTIMHPKMDFVSNLPGMTSLDVGPEGELYLGTIHGLWCYRPRLEIRQQWMESNASAPRLSFRDSVSWEALSASFVSKATQTPALSIVTINGQPTETSEVALRTTFVLPLPSLGRTYYLPLALIRARCPSLLDQQTLSAMHQLHLTQDSWNLFLTYFLEDSLPTFDSPSEHWSNVIHLAVIADTLNLKALAEHCLWINFMFCARPINAQSLATALHTVGRIINSVSAMAGLKQKALPDTKMIVDELIMAVVNHNSLFDAANLIELLKGALPTKYNDDLKLKLRNEKPKPLYYSGQKRCRLPQSPFGHLPTQLLKLWSETFTKSTGAGQDYTDMKLEVSDEGKSVLIPCHLFVLHSRWAFIKPMVKHSFKEMQERQLQLLKPDGTLFEFSWAIQFLRYLYTGQLDMLSNTEFVQTTIEYADYFMLNPSQDPNEPNHSQFIKLLQTAHGFAFPAQQDAPTDVEAP